MCGHSDANLVRYEKAIQLHFDSKYQIAWLTLRNYGFVFHRCPWVGVFGTVEEVTIGIPAGSFTSEEADGFATDDMLRRRVKLAKPAEAGPLSISAFLDVPEIIKFQQSILGLAQSHSNSGRAWRKNAGRYEPVTQRTGYTRESMFDLLHEMFLDLGFEHPTFSIHTRRPQDAALDIRIRLVATLSQSPGAPWIEKQMKENLQECTGMIAYLPMPALIIEEQQTVLDAKKPGTGKTLNQDMRDICPLYLPGVDRFNNEKTRKSSKGKAFKCDVFIKKLDDERKKPNSDFDTMHRKGFLDREEFPKGVGYLHEHLDRIDCYAFRGDSRDPVNLKRADGFGPGVTRTDGGVKDYRAHAIVINLAVTKRKGELEDAIRLQMKETGWENSYDELMQYEINKVKVCELLKFSFQDLLMHFDILTLGVYTADHAFKGYISTTTSTAIAKALAGIYAEVKNESLLNYCYAVRCKNGFHLPTNVDAQEEWDKKKHAQNAFTHYAEQEVAVAGGILWQDVCGMRAIKIEQSGQHFCGPVFLIETLKSSYQPPKSKIALGTRRDNNHNGPQMTVFKPEHDDRGFGELFELLSGKSQGPGFEIEFTYQDAPFDCPGWLMEERNKHH